MSEPNTDFKPPVTPKAGGISPPEVNKEPPPEILKQTFTMDPTISTTGDQRVLTEGRDGKTTAVKIDDGKKEEKKDETPTKEAQPSGEKKVDESKESGGDKKEDKKDVKVENKEDAPKLPPYLKPPKGKEVKGEKGKERDYSGFTADEQKVLKQMSNEAFDFTTQLMKKSKEGSTDTFYQHPQGFVLDPEYQNLNVKAELAQREQKIWLETLQKLVKGEKVKVLEAFDKDGNPVYTNQEVEPNQILEEKVRLAVSQCDRVFNENVAKLRQYPQQYQQKIIQDHSAIQQHRQKAFPWVANKELLDYTLTITNDKGEQVDRSIGDIRNDIVSLFPQYMRHGPVAETLGDMTVALVMAKIELEEAKKGQQVAEIKREELQRGEPSSQIKPVPEANGTAKIGRVKEFTMEPGLNLTGIR